MHESSMNLMKNFVNNFLDINKELKIVDIGSLDINGSYKSLFENENWEYIGLDIEEGKNVNIVLENENELLFDNDSIDVVISGQAFEHMEFPWIVIKEVSRTLKPNGLACIIAPSSGPYHAYPRDCWRILPDGMKALAKFAGLEVIEIGSSGGTWNDTYLIAKKGNE